MLLGNLLLRGLYAFYTEHERCGEWEGGVEGEWVFNLLAMIRQMEGASREASPHLSTTLLPASYNGGVPIFSSIMSAVCSAPSTHPWASE